MKSNFHMKGWSPRLTLRKRLKVIRKQPITISFSVAIRVPELNVCAGMLLGNRTSATASCLRDSGGARAFSCSLGFFYMRNDKREISSVPT